MNKLKFKLITMPGLDRTGPDGQGSKTGRKLGLCKKTRNDESTEDYGKGMGMRRNSGGGRGKGRRIKSSMRNSKIK